MLPLTRLYHCSKVLVSAALWKKSHIFKCQLKAKQESTHRLLIWPGLVSLELPCHCICQGNAKWAQMWEEGGKKCVCCRQWQDQESVRKLSNSSFSRSCSFWSKKGNSRAKKAAIWWWTVTDNPGKALHHPGSHTCFRIYKIGWRKMVLTLLSTVRGWQWGIIQIWEKITLKAKVVKPQRTGRDGLPIKQPSQRHRKELGGQWGDSGAHC